MDKTESLGRSILKEADIEVNGPDPWDIQIHNKDFFKRVLSEGSLGFGESYMDGWWDCERLDQCLYRIYKAGIQEKVVRNWKLLIFALGARLANPQRISKAYEIGQKHYDVGNDLYERMLDKRMVYTCAYWKNAETLDEAQENKLELCCRKLGLKPGDKVLDIGCGWGSFMKYAAEKYGVESVGITVSKEQAELAKKNCEGLPIEIRLQDYREVNEKFDHIISLGMIEHVGYKNYRNYMRIVSQNLKDNGLFLLQTIANNRSVKSGDPWIDRYIFTNSMLPSIKQIGESIEHQLIMEDWHNFGAYYDLTLMAWYKNFNDHWNELNGKYDDRFKRMWDFYLLVFAGLFRARHFNLWQIVFSKNGIEGGYNSVR